MVDKPLFETALFDIAILFREGGFYGRVRYKTSSLYPSMVMHGIGNSVAVLERLLK
ncbi:hypothetical protein [Pseudochelatococcus contaminans]|uniref:Membrane protease YdiL (CAAX protease family) n=1 Tax=Pseudochelatococcus contaminans TaxID=1538103 RepID=A0A7W5Z878_9HYPH|nr:hypothetical protein [Pseudochelatococcus contaminans]MBB3811434.1 membrane protease YdiL (CAAX protease family) [Pseudochelatococcus contaminans]